MPTNLTEQQIANAVSAAKPDPVVIGEAWSAERRDRVLLDVLCSSAAAATRGSTDLRALVSAGDGRTKRKQSKRRSRWMLGAAAAAVLVIVGLAVQVVAPVGKPGSPQAAAALDRLATAVPDGPAIPAEAYEFTVYQDSGVLESDKGPVTFAARRSTWTAPDGWSWARQTGDDAAYYLFAPAPKNFDLASVPADPAVMEAYLRVRVGGSTSVDEAVFEAVRATLMFTPTPTETRASAIRMLARLSGITVTDGASDPHGRTATRIDFADELQRPGYVNSIFVDPRTTQLLAELKTHDGTPQYTCVYTERRVVQELPDDVVAKLGSERKPKIIP